MKLITTLLKPLTGFLSLILLMTAISVQAQVTSNPVFPTDAEEIIITFNATGTDLESYTGDIYAHTGVNIEGVGNWQHVIGSWNNNTTQPKLTDLGENLYQLVITPNIREYYSVPDGSKVIGLAFVFRAATGSPQSADLFIEVFEPTLNVAITNPPKGQPIVEMGATLTVKAASNMAENLSLYVDDNQVEFTTDEEISYDFITTDYGHGTFWLIAKAQDADDNVVYDSTYVFVRSQPEVAALPDDVIPGINYIDDNTVTLVLHDPPALKEFVFVIGDFNDWMVNEEGYMNVTPDGTHFWITLTDLTPDTEYGFQYFIDNELRLADPYTHKVLDPWNDHWINEYNYPNLKPYPVNKTTGLVSILHPARETYQWQTTDFNPPAPEDMVIYELLIRDFVETSAIKDVMEKLDYLEELGVNVIELMPINQFEGNISWGYNPALYFATDKAYGTIEDYKRFIDECHSRGIAVVLDIVLNHSFNLSPHVQMYFDPNAGNWGKPSPDNPWFLEDCPHEPWCWGNTFDQNSPYVHEMFNRITEFWLTEFRVDGFRFDFTKGFTNQQTGGQGWNYDAARVANLKRIANHVWSVNPDAYVILEHFTANDEEKELADSGMLIWGNITHAYQEAAMGWMPQSNFNGMSHIGRGWNDPHLIGYMESHDEERIMHKNLSYGNSDNPNHNIKSLGTALRRAELAAAFYFTIPGPKMIWQFGELGYDYSINHCGNSPVNPIPANLTDPNDPGRCRTDPKPIRWDYYDDWQRKRLYDVYSILTELKKENDIFRTDDFTIVAGGTGKRIHLNDTDNNVTVLGNFGVQPLDISPNFQQTGTWYEFFSRETLEVTNTNDAITLQPGEYRLYSTAEFPDHGLPLSTRPLISEEASKVSIFPNPSDRGFNFSFNAGSDYHIRIINMQGQVVYEQMNAFGPGQSNFFWSGENAPGGIYFYNIFSGGQSVNGKIMVK